MTAVIALIVLALVASCYTAGYLHATMRRPQQTQRHRRFRRPVRRRAA